MTAALADQSFAATRVTRMGTFSPSWGTAFIEGTIVQPFHVDTGRRFLAKVLAFVTPTGTALVIVGAASCAGWGWDRGWNWCGD